MTSQEMQAFVTLATNDAYCLGALVLAHSLKRVGTSRKIVIMVTDSVTPSMKTKLGSIFDEVVTVNIMDSQDDTNLRLLTRPDLGVTFTKLHCWKLTQYSKCVFLDADTLVLHNVDDLFQREELSACPDVGWPDCFNSGVFVYKPSLETYKALLEFASKHGSFDGGDQGLLNMFFNTWAHEDIRKHLPFVYNVVSSTFYFYAPAFKQFAMNTKIVHFIGAKKPWHHSELSSSAYQAPIQTIGESAYLQFWWDLFMQHVHPCVQDIDILNLSQLSISKYYTSEQLSGRHRQYSWEDGQIDYHGMDSFSLIQEHIQNVIDTPASTTTASSSPTLTSSTKGILKH